MIDRAGPVGRASTGTRRRCVLTPLVLYTCNMVDKGRHPKQPIAHAIKAVQRDGLSVVEIHKGHRWGAVVCTVCGADLAIYSTPKVPEHAADRIRKFDRQHRHQ